MPGELLRDKAESKISEGERGRQDGGVSRSKDEEGEEDGCKVSPSRSDAGVVQDVRKLGTYGEVRTFLSFDAVPLGNEIDTLVPTGRKYVPAS